MMIRRGLVLAWKSESLNTPKEKDDACVQATALLGELYALSTYWICNYKPALSMMRFKVLTSLQRHLR